MTLKKNTIYTEKVIKQTSAVISREVKKLIPVIRDYLAGQPVERAYLFGSCARGEENEKSDIDLLVTYDPTRKVTLFTISRMMLSLQRLVNRPVDIDYVADIVKNDLKPLSNAVCYLKNKINENISKETAITRKKTPHRKKGFSI